MEDNSSLISSKIKKVSTRSKVSNNVFKYKKNIALISISENYVMHKDIFLKVHG